MKNEQLSNPKIDSKNLPAVLGGTPVFEISEDDSVSEIRSMEANH